jgi:hypothetical protein
MNSNIIYQRQDNNKAGPENTAALFVSLYVVILAFFILLTSNAQFDAEKTQHVTDSVKKAFSVEIPTDVDVKTPHVGDQLSVTQFFEEMQSSVQSIVPLDEMEVITDGNRMIIKMDSTALFNRDDPSLRYDRRGFYTRLSDTMSKWRGGMQMQLSFLQGVDKLLASDANASSTLEITRAGNFVRFMENRGAPPKNLSVAIEQGAGETITLIFDVLAFNAEKLDFSAEETPKQPAPPQGAIPLSGIRGARP